MHCFTLFTHRAARESFADSKHNMPQLRQLQSLSESSRNMFSKVKGTLKLCWPEVSACEDTKRGHGNESGR